MLEHADLPAAFRAWEDTRFYPIDGLMQAPAAT